MLRLPLLALAAAAVAVDAAKVLIPLYKWDDQCWPELQSAAAKNPTASFIAVINPNSGPIIDVNDPNLYCVPVLRQKIPNLTVLGHLRTGYGDRSASDVKADVAMYETWAGLSVSAGGVEGTPKLDGIFFDESPSFQDSETGLDTYKGYATVARSALGSGATVIFNPGTPSSSKLYAFADYVVAYESYYKNFASAKLPTDAALQAKSAIMLHDFPSDSSTLSSTVSSLAPSYGALWISDVSIDEKDIYKYWGSNWNAFVADVAAASSTAPIEVSSTSVPTTTKSTATAPCKSHRHAQAQSPIK
ncbi:hypothetical protein JCM10213_007713 [Rhodosporidiobolus nylandii]